MGEDLTSKVVYLAANKETSFSLVCTNAHAVNEMAAYQTDAVVAL